MYKKDIIKLARELRRNQTPAELYLWDKLRNRKFYGTKFLRQHPIIAERKDNHFDFFIADFYCHESKLVIEVDGKIHDYQKDSDKQRDHIMSELGLKVLRIKNDEVLNQIDKVNYKIRQYL